MMMVMTKKSLKKYLSSLYLLQKKKFKHNTAISNMLFFIINRLDCII